MLDVKDRISVARNWGGGKGDEAGICFAMVLSWLKRCITLTGNSRVTWDQRDEIQKAQGLYASYVQKAKLSAKLSGTLEDYLAAGKTIVEANGLRYGEKSGKEVFFSGNVVQVFQRIVDKKEDDQDAAKAKFRAYDVGCAGHATGVFVWGPDRTPGKLVDAKQDEVKNFFFFDPNYGVYEYTADGFEEHVIEHYVKSYCGGDRSKPAFLCRVRLPK